MASITKRGDSYRIKVSCGYDIKGKQITTTNRYVHAIEEADRMAGDTLGNIVCDLSLKRA